MSQHSKRKGLIYGQVLAINTLSTLADGSLAANAFPNTVNDSRLAIYLKGVWSLRGAAAGEGPLEFGVAHSDYTAAEIEESLESAGNWDLGDKIAQEQANRRVRRIGEFRGVTATGQEEVVNDGKPIFTRLNWKLAEGDTLAIWTRNGSGATLTTGASVAFKGKLVMKPIKG